MGDGRLKFSVGYTNKDYILSWILGFGDKAKIVEPEDMAKELTQLAKNIIIKYGHDI